MLGNSSKPPLGFDGTAEELRPLVEVVVSEVLHRLEQNRERTADRLSYTEAEAASLLGIERHVLRDCRLRGEITGRKVGKRILYAREELVGFLDRAQV